AMLLDPERRGGLGSASAGLLRRVLGGPTRFVPAGAKRSGGGPTGHSLPLLRGGLVLLDCVGPDGIPLRGGQRAVLRPRDHQVDRRAGIALVLDEAWEVVGLHARAVAVAPVEDLTLVE